MTQLICARTAKCGLRSCWTLQWLRIRAAVWDEAALFFESQEKRWVQSMIRRARIDMVPLVMLDLEIDGQRRGEKKEMLKLTQPHLLHILSEKRRSLAWCGPGRLVLVG
jgi:hypothetical protein